MNQNFDTPPFHPFAVSLDKIRGTRKSKEKGIFLCYFTRLQYLCNV